MYLATVLFELFVRKIDFPASIILQTGISSSGKPPK